MHLLAAGCGPSRQLAFFGPTVANGALRTWLDLQLAPHGREEDCTALAVDAIDRAETQILVSAYGLTTSSKAVEALTQAKRRGVDVRVIADSTTPCERKSGLSSLVEAGVPIWIDNGVRIAHSKSMVIDSQVTLTGWCRPGCGWN